MSTVLDIITCVEDASYDVEVNVTDEVLQCLDFSAIEEKVGKGKRLINFYLDRTLSLEESLVVLERLERLASEDGSISIYTSGRNFNGLMKAIKLRKSATHHELHIDDHDIRSDFSHPIDEYSEFDEITYFNLKNSVEAARKTFVFSPVIIGSSVWNEDYSAEDIYRIVGAKGSGKLPLMNHSFKVRTASRKIMDKVHVKKKFPEKFNKRNRHDINK